MSNQAKIKDLTLRLKDCERNCNIWIELNKKQFKNIEQLEYEKTELIRLVNFLARYVPDGLIPEEDIELIKKYKSEN